MSDLLESQRERFPDEESFYGNYMEDTQNATNENEEEGASRYSSNSFSEDEDYQKKGKQNLDTNSEIYQDNEVKEKSITHSSSEEESDTEKGNTLERQERGMSRTQTDSASEEEEKECENFLWDNDSLHLHLTETVPDAPQDNFVSIFLPSQKWLALCVFEDKLNDFLLMKAILPTNETFSEEVLSRLASSKLSQLEEDTFRAFVDAETLSAEKRKVLKLFSCEGDELLNNAITSVYGNNGKDNIIRACSKDIPLFSLTPELEFCFHGVDMLPHNELKLWAKKLGSDIEIDEGLRDLVKLLLLKSKDSHLSELLGWFRNNSDLFFFSGPVKQASLDKIRLLVNYRTLICRLPRETDGIPDFRELSLLLSVDRWKREMIEEKIERMIATTVKFLLWINKTSLSEESNVPWKEMMERYGGILYRAYKVASCLGVMKPFHFSPALVYEKVTEKQDLFFLAKDLSRACLLFITICMVPMTVFEPYFRCHGNTVVVTSRARRFYEKRQEDVHISFGSENPIILSTDVLCDILLAMRNKGDIVI